MTDENESLIGFDPLAWMKEEGEQGEEAAQSESAEPETAASAPEPQPEPAVAEAAGDGAVVVELGEQFDIAHVGAFYDRFQEVLNAHQEVVLDASQLERVDGAGLQLLAAFHREMAGREVGVSWREPSEALREAAGQLDLSEVLGLAA